MRRLAAIAILLALLMAIPSAPALAYKRKRTVTVGIDSGLFVMNSAFAILVGLPDGVWGRAGRGRRL